MTATITNQRVNIRLTREQHEYLNEISWRNRTSMTEYVRELISKDMKVTNIKPATGNAATGLTQDYDGF